MLSRISLVVFLLFILGTTANANSPSLLCDSVTGLNATNITDTSATLNWDAAVSDSFLVKYYITGSTNYNYLIVNPGTAVSVNLTSLLPNTNYSWLIHTYCSGGQLGPYQLVPDTFKTSPCNVVNALTTTNITNTGATLNWAATVCDSFLVRYHVTGTTNYFYHRVSSGAAVTTNITLLYPNTNYTWTIHTYCGGLEGLYAVTPSAFTTFYTPAYCLVPNNLAATNITYNTATLSWNNLVNADSFLVRYNEIGSSAYNWIAVGGTTHSFLVTGLTTHTTYIWKVRGFCTGTGNTYSDSSVFVTSSTILPVPDHIVICIMENKGYTQIIGNIAAPYINALDSDSMSASFTQSYGIGHPSQPNYLELFSGSNQGMTNNNLPSAHFTTPNLAAQLIAAGKTFITYSDSLPSVGFDGASYGKYMRKHNPVANWMGTGTNQVPITCNQPFTVFPTDYSTLPTVAYVVPNQDNDMHDGTIPAGDLWVQNNMDAYVQWAKQNNSLFILHFDEDNGAFNNRVPTIFLGPMVRDGQYAMHITHHNILRTIEDMYGLPQAGNAAASGCIDDCWANGITEVKYEIRNTKYEIRISPNPAKDEFTIHNSQFTIEKVEIYNLLGEIKYAATTNGKQVTIKPNLAAGFYFVRVSDNRKTISGKIVIE